MIEQTRLIQLDHSEVVKAVQVAMVRQLHRDGRYFEDMELGLTIYAPSLDDAHATASVRYKGKDLFNMEGNRSQLCAVVTDLALSKLAKGESQRYRPQASVRWRMVRLSDEDGSKDIIVADVEFCERALAKGA